MSFSRKSILILAGLGLFGIAIGYSARKSVPSKGDGLEVHELILQSDTKGGDGGVAGRGLDLASFPRIKSVETLESLLEIPNERLYHPLALWLADASEGEIAEFWAEYSKREDQWNDVVDLIFLNWARLDARAAIEKSGSDHHAWWAWAAHDPEAALAEAQAHAPGHINNVAWGIGEFHPAWLRRHFRELSEDALDHALRGMEKWQDVRDPLASLEFRKEMGRGLDVDTFKALVRVDPWGALDWLKENDGSDEAFGYGQGGAMKALVETMAISRPDDLRLLAEQTPSGELKLQMEAALFKQLVETDPEAALEDARAVRAPFVAAERYAELGSRLIKDDPERAFEVVEELLETCPDVLRYSVSIELPTSVHKRYASVPGMDQFIQELVMNDAERMIEIAKDYVGDYTGGYASQSVFSRASREWASQDVRAYGEWLTRQSDELLQATGGAVLAQELQRQGYYEDAIEWMVASGNEVSYLDGIIMDWWRKEPPAVVEWLENADMPEEDREKLLKKYGY